MKLFVDDIRRQWEGWHRARTVTEAIRILATMPVEIVSLDHDIACYLVSGHEHSSEETFEPVARYIALMGGDAPFVQFHTGNPEGGQKMARIIGVPYMWVSYSHFGEIK